MPALYWGKEHYKTWCQHREVSADESLSWTCLWTPLWMWVQRRKKRKSQGKQAWSCIETWIREWRAPAWWSSHSQVDWMGSRLSLNWGSCNCNRLAWRVQVRSMSSCWWLAKMRCDPHLFLIQGLIGQKGDRRKAGQPDYLQGGNLMHQALRNGHC